MTDEHMADVDKSKRDNRFLILAILLASVAGLSAGVGVYLAKKPVAPGMVTFDTARYLNARRASMAALLGREQGGDTSVNTAAIVHQVDETARPVIEELAAGRLVVVKQALALSGQVPDITDAVIKKLGLVDTKMTVPVPSVDDIANSYSSSDLYQAAKLLQQKRNERAAQDAPAMQDGYINQQNKQILP